MRKVIFLLTALAVAPVASADKLDDFVYEFSAEAKERFSGQINAERFGELEDEGGNVSQNMVDAINERFGKYAEPVIEDLKKDLDNRYPSEAKIDEPDRSFI
nr:hypothetical protein [Vibrio splendidus]MCC4883029.1 hypothetical protein [Vibrio splendidus]